GPYRVAGWSFGGVLAYEVAMQLLGLDESVAFLGLIDTLVPRMTDQGKARWEGPQALKRHLLLQCTAHWTVQGGAHEVARLAQLEADTQ
ncbi:thioesterase domain-containing protein, partial [Pseudomonas lurida]|uniref:thioesterase domain-containing protein n=1 Tax=Pseudomonas lurida TaxID=244566 RepID=UPI0034D96354